MSQRVQKRRDALRAAGLIGHLDAEGMLAVTRALAVFFAIA